MLSRGYSFNTIAGFRTAISEMHENVNGKPIGSHPDIARVIQAIHTEKPPSTPSDDPIDLTPSLDYIKELGNNNDMSIRDLSIKAAFLLALVTASRPSDLKRVDLSTLKKSPTSFTFDCIHPKEYNIARSHSISTTKRSSKKIYVGYYKDEELLCPYRTLESLFSRTDKWRNDQKKQKSLFLITKPPYTPAASDTIAGWIKSIIKLSSPNSTAKDMRVHSAFFLQNSGADLSTILALGNWSSNTVYQRFYQRGIKLMLERNQVSSIILDSANNTL